MWPYPQTLVGTPPQPGHLDRVAVILPSQARARAAEEAPNIGQWGGQDVPLATPSSCTVKGSIPSSRRCLPTLPTSVTHCSGHSCPALLSRCEGRENNGEVLQKRRGDVVWCADKACLYPQKWRTTIAMYGHNWRGATPLHPPARINHAARISMHTFAPPWHFLLHRHILPHVSCPPPPPYVVLHYGCSPQSSRCIFL